MHSHSKDQVMGGPKRYRQIFLKLAFNYAVSVSVGMHCFFVFIKIQQYLMENKKVFHQKKLSSSEFRTTEIL